MSHSSDPPRRRGAIVLRVVAATIVAVPLITIAALAIGAMRPRSNSPHGALDLECGWCHGAQGWKPARISTKFDHSAFGFALEGAHAAAGCLSCHVSLDFEKQEKRCQSCHEDPHRGEMGNDCARCHGARSFLDRGPMIRAHQLTFFPMTGSHAGLECESCHQREAEGRLQFVGTRADCQSCHLEQYRATTDPDHEAGGFTTECRTCHSPVTWHKARFDHARTRFPLTGAHRATPCTSCHAAGTYRGTRSDCASCHQADYDGAPFNHAAAGFQASACASCHTTTSWSGASFDHDGSFFPIYSGAHRGKWSQCADCHTSPADFRDFTCLSCHPHSDRTGTDACHSGTSGYRYESASCYSCHPRGSH